MTNQELDISTRVLENATKRTGVIIFNRSRKSDKTVVVEYDDNFEIALLNIFGLSVKYGSEEWVPVATLGKRK